MALDPRLKKPLTLTFPAGMNTRARETELPKGAARAAVNVDFTREGHVLFAAGGYSVVAGAEGGHSLWSWPGLGYALYVGSSGTLIRIEADGARTDLTPVSAHRPMSYALVNGRVYYANGADMGMVVGGALRPWGIDPPPPPLASEAEHGGLPAGRYLVAITVLYNEGEESAPSAPQTLTLGAGRGIRLTLPTSPAISHVLIYCSSTQSANGEELFYHGQAANGDAQYLITAQASGHRLTTLFLGRMPCGTILAPFKRRLLAAIGENLYFSEVEQLSLCNRRHGWLPFGDPITAIAPVDDGCYVGTDTATYWCAGTDPTDWTRTLIRPFGIARQSSVPYLPEDAFPADGAPRGTAVPWFGQDGGLCVGRNGGVVQLITQAAVGVAPHQEATCFYHEQSGVRQVIAALRGVRHDTRSTPDSTPVRTERYGLTT